MRNSDPSAAVVGSAGFPSSDLENRGDLPCGVRVSVVTGDLLEQDDVDALVNPWNRPTALAVAAGRSQWCVEEADRPWSLS